MLVLIRNSLILAIGFYLSIIFLPEVLYINETVSKYLMVMAASLWLLRSKNRWWFNIISVFLGLIILLTVFEFI
ncbi:hypothetical protein CN265_05255 [Priestia megaterium]|nr:hypothetical protein CN265_05255 [Priestia megaterium]